AEDGIRDFHVTGVQTCALPIYLDGRRRLPGVPGRQEASRRGRSRGACETISEPAQADRRGPSADGATIRSRNDDIHEFHRQRVRSEERRVGKEWRYRGTWHDER